MSTDRTRFAPETLGKIQGITGRNAEPDAWRRLIGDKPVSARIELLPEARIRPTAWLASVIIQTALAAFVVAIPLLFPSTLGTFLSYEVTPVTTLETRVLLPTDKPQPPRTESRSIPAAPVIQPELAHLSRKTLFAPMVARRNARVSVQQPEAPVIDQNFGVLALEDSREPVRPRDPVKTGVIADGIPVPASIAPPAANVRVQTGTFGETHNQPGESTPDNRSQAVYVGALNAAEAVPSGKSPGTASNAKGAVTNSGFGNAIVSSAPPNPAHEEVKLSGFASAATSPDAERPKKSDPGPATEPVVILEKPNPVYTDEARRLGIEGEVQIRAVFLATGSVNVLGISKGLGYGLDEAAMRAARQIRFKPAQRDGKAVDFPATIRIMFQLAF
jgi:TonB family protein